MPQDSISLASLSKYRDLVVQIAFGNSRIGPNTLQLSGLWYIRTLFLPVCYLTRSDYVSQQNKLSAGERGKEQKTWLHSSYVPNYICKYLRQNCNGVSTGSRCHSATSCPYIRIMTVINHFPISMRQVNP